MKRFGRGLVVGKFCPLHRGHQYLIDAALAQCDELVLISYTRPAFAGCDALAREHWLSTLYPQTRRLVLDEARFAALASSLGWPRAVLPENDAPEEVHRELVGWLCHRALDVGIDAVFTSEAYGDGFATALTRFLRYHRDTDHPRVQHVCVDRARQAVPVSGTALRRDPHGLRHHLSPVVYAAFVQRVCLLGGESSGKTTLAQALAEQWNTAWVPEYGRERWEAQGGRLAFDDLTDIGRIQLERERAACARPPLAVLRYRSADHTAVLPRSVWARRCRTRTVGRASLRARVPVRTGLPVRPGWHSARRALPPGAGPLVPARIAGARHRL